MEYRKKPIVVEAIQFTGDTDNIVALSGFMDVEIRINYKDPNNPELIICTLEGDMTAVVGDWIIKGVKNEFYPCKPDIFEATYERVEEDTNNVCCAASSDGQDQQQGEENV